MLARKLGGHCSIHVVDSAEPATPGFGEASQPVVLELLKFLGRWARFLFGRHQTRP